MELKLMVFDATYEPTIERVLKEARNISINQGHTDILTNFLDALDQSVPMRTPTVNDWARAKVQHEREQSAVARREEAKLKSNDKAKAILRFLEAFPDENYRANVVAGAVKMSPPDSRKMLDDMVKRKMIRQSDQFPGASPRYQALEPVQEEDVDDPEDPYGDDFHE